MAIKLLPFGMQALLRSAHVLKGCNFIAPLALNQQFFIAILHYFSIFRTQFHLLNPFQMQKRMPKMGVKSSHFLPEKERKFLFYSFVSVKSVNRALIPDKKVRFFFVFMKSCQSKKIKYLDSLARIVIPLSQIIEK